MAAASNYRYGSRSGEQYTCIGMSKHEGVRAGRRRVPAPEKGEVVNRRARGPILHMQPRRGTCEYCVGAPPSTMAIALP